MLGDMRVWKWLRSQWRWVEGSETVAALGSRLGLDAVLAWLLKLVAPVVVGLGGLVQSGWPVAVTLGLAVFVTLTLYFDRRRHQQSSPVLPPVAAIVTSPNGGPVADSPPLITAPPDALPATQGAIVAEDKLARGELNALKEVMQFQMRQLHDSIAHNRAEFRDFRDRIIKVLRARDAEDELKRLDADAALVFERLARGEPREMTEWQRELAGWNTRIRQFWKIVGEWLTGETPDPLKFAEGNVDFHIGVPPGPIFESDAMRHHYRMMVVAESKHREWRHRAFEIMSAEANPPG